MTNEHDPPKRPYIDPRLARHIALIDSLTAAAGFAPDTILNRRVPLDAGLPETTTGWYEPERRHMRVSPTSRNERTTLLHEFGHVAMHADPDLYERIVREGLRQEPRYVRDRRGTVRPVEAQAERFADAFRDAFDFLSRERGDTTQIRRQRSDVQPLVRHLARRLPFTLATALDAAANDSSPQRP